MHEPNAWGFVACCLTATADALHNLTGPVLLMYGDAMGASVWMIAAFQASRWVMASLSVPLMAAVAEGGGRSLAIAVSTLGVCLGYGIQGAAGLVSQPWLMLLGSCMGGLSKGARPLLKAHVMETAPYLDLRNERLLKLDGLPYLSIMVFAPIGGALAQLSLSAPFFTAAAFTLALLALLPCILTDSSDGLTAHASSQRAEGDNWSKTLVRAYKDRVLVGCFVAITCSFAAKGGHFFVRALILQDPVFGFASDSVEETRIGVSRCNGWLSFCHSASSIMTMFGVAKMGAPDRFGLSCFACLSGLVGTTAFIIYGAAASNVTLLVVLEVAIGSSSGAFLAATIHAFSRYAARADGSAHASATAAVLMGNPLGEALGPLLGAGIFRGGGPLAWRAPALAAFGALHSLSCVLVVVLFRCLAPRRLASLDCPEYDLAHEVIPFMAVRRTRSAPAICWGEDHALVFGRVLRKRCMSAPSRLDETDLCTEEEAAVMAKRFPPTPTTYGRQIIHC
mmetsp:Transcript_79321/g.224534  ORF Transcript_79321/g.224534 Transcript_79321/m.224534 type:complete len:508 (-) Transcript_79321:44-1567(-)